MMKYVQISMGELLDKISILEIKSEKIQDEPKLLHIENELSILSNDVSDLDNYRGWVDKLKTVNKKLWIIEDSIREKERNKAFDDEFIKLARSVYYTNDERFDIKDQINKYYGSELQEQKSYEDYN